MGESVFFGYPESPRSGAEVMRNSARGIRDKLGVDTGTWEELGVDGRIVIEEVLKAIDDSSMSIFDVSTPNPNVLFEAGYAIARAKPVWLTLDSTSSSAKRSWKAFAIARDIGYTSYRNSDDLIASFQKNNPIETLTPVFDTLIEGFLPDAPTSRDGLLYCTTFEPFEAANRLSSFMDSRQRLGIRVATADPSESSVLPLRWYLQEMAKSAGVLVHFAGPNRNLASLHNNRHAFIAGLALGLNIPTLLLAESDYSAPFDFESILRVYETSEECIEETRAWLDSIQFENISFTPRRPNRNPLSDLRFGEHVAENERTELGDYFVETAAFNEVVAARDSIFVGHRGTGKTANATQAFTTIAANKTNLAVLIKPPGFEFPAMLATVSELPEYQHDYFFDSLWRFIVQTEIAATIIKRLQERPTAVPYSPDEQSFLDYVENAPFDLRAEVSVRLEQALDSLRESTLGMKRDDVSRNYINEAFHSKSLAVLRMQLGKVLKDRKRVAVFVDNLDKGWERGTDFGMMARFILGLLSARGQIVTDFQKQDFWRDAIKLTVSIFLRSDIYLYLRREAREPDKLPISTVVWKDWAALKNVIDSRFLYSGSSQGDVNELWEEIFCPYVEKEPLQDYLKRIVLPRPRDLVFMCNAAVGRAIDRGHTSVTAEDFQAARETYSQYAYEALLVENGVTIPEMEDALLAFIDAPSIATYAQRTTALLDSGIQEVDHERLISKLTSISFFGVETEPGVFIYPDGGSELAASVARQRRLQPKRDLQRLQIHSAFHSFLGITLDS